MTGGPPFPSYVRPNTVKRAFAFGKVSARAGHERLSRAEFDSVPEPGRPPHPFPSSLYRAYKKGWTAGHEIRRSRLAELAASHGRATG